MFDSRTVFRICLVAFLVVLAGEASALETAERRLTVDHALAGRSLRVENLLGSVEVRTAADAESVHIEARVVGEAKTAAEAKSLVESVLLDQQVVGDEVRVRAVFPLDRFSSFRPPKAGVKGFVSRWTAPLLRRRATVEYDDRIVQVGPDRKATGLAVHLTVSLPYDIRASIAQAVGLIHARALRGELRFETTDGDVEADMMFGSLQVETQGGQVTVRSFQGTDLAVRSDSGNLSLVEVRADRVRLRTGTGVVRAGGLTAGDLEVESVSGGIGLDGVEPARLAVTAGSGDVDVATQLRQLETGTIRSATGDVVLRVGRFAHFDLLADTKSGEVKTAGVTLSEAEGRLRLGQGGPQLRVTAEQGSLTVRAQQADRPSILAGTSD